VVCDIVSSACANDCLAVIQRTKKLDWRGWDRCRTG